MWSIILGVTVILYLITNLILVDGIALYLLQPLLWLGLTLMIRKYGRSTLRSDSTTKTMILTSALLGGLQVATLMWTSIFTSFGQSPYLHTPLYLVLNTLFFASQLIGLEMSRAAIVQAWHQHHLTLRLGVVTLLYTGFSLSFTQLIRVDLAPLPFVTFLISTGLPALAGSFLATYLAVLGGPVAAIAYRGVLIAFEWYSPLLPNPPLAIRTLISVMLPIISVLMINATAMPRLLQRMGVIASTQRRTRRNRTSQASATGWITISVVCVVLVWATTGLLGFYPSTVVSGSMNPTVNVGDLAFITPVDATSLHVGDVISYRVDEVMVLHRIVGILSSENTLLFTTKGDANTASDPDPVFPAQIQGKLLVTVPKIGWIAIAIKSVALTLWMMVTTNPVLVGGITVLLSTGVYLLRGARKRRL
jgi:signal peptidase